MKIEGVFFYFDTKMTITSSLFGKYVLFLGFSPPTVSGLRPEEINMVLENICLGYDPVGTYCETAIQV